MSSFRIISLCVLLLFVQVIFSTASGQRKERRRIVGVVTYVSSVTFYFDAGRAKGLEVGDTVMVSRKLQQRAVGVVAAVSSSSASASVVTQSSAVTAGDTAVVVKDIIIEEPVVGAPTKLTASQSAALRFPSRPENNTITGRFALQYGAAGEFGKPLDFSQPAAILRLEVARLFGTGTTFTFYGRTYSDLTANFDRFGDGPRTKLRMYELSLGYDSRRAWYGYAIGRITSRYVGGLGAFDGGQFYFRRGRLTVGTLAGAQTDYSTTQIDPDLLKFAAFANYAWGGDVFATSDVTVAYGQQRYKGKIDRVFGYVQSSLRFGTDLYFYSSTELDFQKIENGVRSKQMRLTNSFVTMTYSPFQWVSINGGYDAARTIYLFESMKAISDTLLDKTLKEGFRASLSFRLPLNVTLGGQANYRLASGTTSSARTLTGSFRIGDILDTDVNLGIQYSNIVGLYTEGEDYTVDIDRWVAQSLSVGFRLDRYKYHIHGQPGELSTITGSGNINFRLSRSLYTVLSFDQVWDNSRNTQRLYFEIGVHF
ncbi:MAG: hypothetical protein AB1428_06220 [Bacteroidota bacterium]